MLAFMFPSHLGGKADDRYPEAISFPAANLPITWQDAAEAGAIRMQLNNDVYWIWKPYPFLMQWMTKRITIFEFADLEELKSEITCGTTAPELRKGYCFQRAGNELENLFNINKLVWNL